MTVEILKSELLIGAGFPIHGFTKASGGVSQGPFSSLNLAYDIGDDDGAVERNIRAFQSAVSVDLPLARVKQVHGAGVVRSSQVASKDWTARPTVEADAIVSSGEEVLAVQTADCAPILLADPKTRVVAAVHAGWRGVAAGVVGKSVREMASLGATPSRIVAVIGPHICRSCYEVGEDVARRLPESADPIRGRPGKYLFDLSNAVEVSLIISQLDTSRIERIQACTSCLKGDLFSYRRDGGISGRMLGFISSF